MFNNDLSRFQRRSLQLFSSSLIFTAFLNMMVRTWFKDYHPAGPFAWLLAIVPALPFIGIVVIIFRYIAGEKDEFIRAQVLLALLQGSFMTLIITVVYSFIQNFLDIKGPPAMFYVDIFLVVSMFALRYHLRNSQ
jgi:hypothetical protein